MKNFTITSIVSAISFFFCIGFSTSVAAQYNNYLDYPIGSKIVKAKPFGNIKQYVPSRSYSYSLIPVTTTRKAMNNMSKWLIESCYNYVTVDVTISGYDAKKRHFFSTKWHGDKSSGISPTQMLIKMNEDILSPHRRRTTTPTGTIVSNRENEIIVQSGGLNKVFSLINPKVAQKGNTITLSGYINSGHLLNTNVKIVFKKITQTLL